MSRRAFVALSLLLDAVFVNLGMIAAFAIRFGYEAWITDQPFAIPAFNFNPYLTLWPFITVAYLAANYVNGVYEPERTESVWDLSRGLVTGTGLGTLLVFSALYIAGPDFNSFPRLVLAISWPVQVVILVTWRLVFMRFSRVALPEQRVLVVGGGKLAIDLATELGARGRWGFRVLGLIEPRPTAECTPPAERGGFPVLGCVDETALIAAERGANRVIVTSPVALRELVESLALADEADVRIDVVPELYEIFIGTVDAIVGDVPLMEITRSSVPPYQAVVKRLIDLLGAAVLIVMLSPVMLFAAIAILLSDGLPVVYSQQRVGRGMRVFPIYKFRTMVKDAEKLSGPVFATGDDPRITGLGRFLRRYRIDELPQLFNVLVGDMSFVGPRPERPYFVDQFVTEIPGYRERFHVKPGVTGLAQVSGGYATTAERKLKYDLIYMYHQNLTMDVRIIVETLQVVLTGRGAL